VTKIFGDGNKTSDKLDSILDDLTLQVGDQKYVFTADQHSLDELQRMKAELERIELHLQSMTDEDFHIEAKAVSE
jgi:hypothetical protein